MTNVPPSDGGAAPDPASPDSPSPVALAATETPVELRVALVEDDRTPDGMVCMGTYRGDRLIARNCRIRTDTTATAPAITSTNTPQLVRAGTAGTA